MEDTDAIPISALNHYAYCPRRCFLIHAESEFEENVHTMRGRAEHERVDEVRYETIMDDGRVERALPVWSERLGLIGKCDVVEFYSDGTVYPVEYKHGRRRKWGNDDLQLAAQALCLEEMTGRPVSRGAIYHASSRRRREVAISDALRAAVVTAVAAVRALLNLGKLPDPVNDARCKECSLKSICQPEAMAATQKIHTLRLSLFTAEDG